MYQGQMIFAQIINLIDRYRFQSCIDRYHGDSKTHALTTQEFFRIMASAQITGRESLRETVLCLNAVPNHLYHLGLPKPLVRSNRLVRQLQVRQNGEIAIASIWV